MKRNFFICCLFALLSSLNVLAFDFEVDGIYYTITGSGTVSVVKGTYDYDGDVTIPITVSNGVETFNVTGIGESAFKSCGELVSVTMPEGLTSIGNEAFYQSSIKTVSLPSTLNSMGTSAFRECKNLTGVVLPDALKDVKENAFYECSNLKTMTLGNQTANIEQYAFYRTAIETVTIPNQVVCINQYAFSHCESMRDLSINDAPAIIANSAFAYCYNLKNINLGNALTGLSVGNESSWTGGYGAFRDCWSIEEIDIPSSLTEIGQHTFQGCKRLYKVNLPNTIEHINDYAFENCAITQITLPSSLLTIDSHAFTNCPITSIIFPSKLKSIKDAAFHNTLLKTVRIPSSVIEIGFEAFSKCNNLKTLKIDDAAVKISGSFYDCPLLENVDLGNNVISFGWGREGGSWEKGTFYNCESLKKIVLPNSLTDTGSYTFANCSQLAEIVFPSSLSTIGIHCFSGCTGLKKIELPNSVASIGDLSFSGCNGLTKVVLSNSLTSIGMAAFEDCSSISEIIIPEKVTSIGQSAFSDCVSLKSLIIDNAVTTIGYGTFRGCTNLETIDLGKTTSLGEYAFADCKNIVEVQIPNSIVGLQTSWDNSSFAFANCSSLKKVLIGTGIKALGNSVFANCVKLSIIEFKGDVLTSIGKSVFQNCRSLKKIDIPASVTSIGETAFDGCSVLSNIYMNPTTPPNISNNTFSDYNTPTLHVPTASKTDYTKADNWKNFTNVIAIGSEPKATTEETAALDALLTEATALYNGSIEGSEPGNYRPGAKAAFKAIIDDVQARFSNNMLAEDAEDCTELLNTAIKSFKNKQVKNEIQTNNTLAFAETLKAAIGSEFRLPIEMNNVDPITGVQFDLYLPEGMTLSEDEYGDYLIELSDRTTVRRHAVASRVMPDGALRVVVSSQQNAAFEGNNGTLLTLVLFPKSTMEAGDHDVELKNIVLTDPDAKRYAAADMKSIITVSAYTMGDVNNDGYIDVADLAGVVRFILENADASLVFNAADMDGNGVVEINDYAALVNVILSQNSPSNTRMFRANAIRNAVITLSTLCLNKDGNGELSVCLPVNDLHYTGLQFDLTLPEGIELLDEGAEATDARHGAWMQKRVDGTYRVICSSMMNDEFCEGEVLRLQVKVTGDVSCESEVVASDVVLSDVNAIRHEAAPAMTILNMDDATGVQDVGSKMEDGSSTIYNLAGQRIQKMQKGLYIVNGKKLFLNK